MRLLPRRLAALAALVMVVPAFAGCADDEEPVTPGATRSDPATPGGAPTGTGGGATTLPPPKPKGTSERWHFHDYWKNTPVITLYNGTLALGPNVTADGTPALNAVVELPQGTIVPPETGFLTFNVTWEGSPGGLLNLTYRPADSNGFFHAGDLGPGAGLDLVTTESMCDVPHRQKSAWLFNFTAAPGGTPPAMPPKDFHLVITATIGRPLFIDPPHVNWWQGLDAIPLVDPVEGAFQGASASGKNVSIPDPAGVSPAATTPSTFTQGQRVPVTEGRIVPEGTRSVVVALNWTAEAPAGAKLKVAWREGNGLTEGVMDVVVDGESSRVFAIPVSPGQTDTTYSNRTTWEFQVLPDSDPAAFKGTYAFAAWVSRLAPADAVKEILG